MNTILGNPDLEASFDELKHTARSNDDIASWFKEHPAVFSGIAGAMPIVSLDVKVVDYLHYAREHAHNKNALELTLSLKIGLALQPPAFLSTYAIDPAKQDNVSINHGYALELPLADWSYATAICTAMFIAQGGLTDTRPWLNELEERLAQHMRKHFPGINMKGFRAMEAAGLLPLDRDGEICTDGIVKLLFDSRRVERDNTPAIPDDMSL